MTQTCSELTIYNSFLEVADQFDALLVDVYGVFWNGTDFVPGAKETLATEVKKGKQVCILSNTSAIDPTGVGKGLIKGIHYTEIITSGMVLHDLLMKDNLPISGHNIYIMGHSKFDLTTGTVFHLADSPEKADIIYFGTPRIKDKSLYLQYQDQFIQTSSELYDMKTVAPLMDELKYLSTLGKPVISTNPDLYALEKGYWVIRQGTLVETYQKLGGVVYEYGKPHHHIYEYAFQKLNIGPSKHVAMIGDTYRTDIKGALGVGISPVWCLDTGVAAYECAQGKSLSEQAGGNLEGITLIHHL